MSRLRAGERFLMPGDPDPWEVLRVTESSATVRPTRKTYVNYDTLDDRVVEFHALRKTVEISPYSVVTRPRGNGG